MSHHAKLYFVKILSPSLRVYFNLEDWWIGVYYDRWNQRIYFCPIPTFVIEWTRYA